MRKMLLLVLLVAGCEMPGAFTLPLPFGGSIVIPLSELTRCGWEHERQHQEQVLRMGSSRFLLAIAAEYAEHGHRCGPLEREAYEAENACAAANWHELSQEDRDAIIGCVPDAQNAHRP